MRFRIESLFCRGSNCKFGFTWHGGKIMFGRLVLAALTSSRPTTKLKNISLQAEHQFEIPQSDPKQDTHPKPETL